MQPEISLSEKLTAIIGSISYLLPELCLLFFLLILIIFDLIYKKHDKKGLFFIISLSALIISFVLLALQWGYIQASGPVALFLGMLTLDGSAIFFKTIFCIAGVVTILFSYNYQYKNEQISRTGEFYVIFLGLLSGTFLMAMSVNLLFIYIAIELVSLSSYLLTHFNFGKKSAEASMKYLLFGAMSSGVMLYGMSLLYGFTGTLDINAHNFISGLIHIDFIPLMLAGVLTIGGFLFKITSVPFHIWAPDVYEGAPTPVVAFFSVVPKIAGLVILIRFLNVFSDAGLIFPEHEMLNIDWQLILSVIAIATMVMGNFSALWQDNAKRMMAYSSIAHGGFMLVGVLAFTQFGMQSMMFYAGVYLFMNFGAFLVINIIADKTGFENITDYKGLGAHYPMLGVAIVILMIALTGLPPTAGFTAKLLVFSAAWESYQNSGNNILIYVFIIGLFNTVVSLFYYLKIPYYMFFKAKSKDTGNELNVFRNVSVLDSVLVAVLVVPLLILFFKSDWLLNIISAIRFTF